MATPAPFESRAQSCHTTLILLCFSSLTSSAQPKDDYLTWTKQQATQIGRKWRVAGRVGWRAGFELFYSGVYYYELRGTMMTPEAIRAAARLEQLGRHLTDDETHALVTEAEKVDGLVVYTLSSTRAKDPA